MAVRVFSKSLRQSSVHAHYAARVFLTKAQVYWVSSTHARTSNTNPGTEAEEPKATLANAISTASAGDIIVTLESHVEAGPIDISKALEVIGVGGTSTRPAITGNGANGVTITAAGVVFRNFKIYETFNELSTGYCLNIAAAGVRCGEIFCEDQTTLAATSTGRICNLASGAGQVWMEGCEFKWGTTGTEAVSANDGGIPFGIYAAADVDGLWLDNCTFDGGTNGFDKGAIHVPSPNAVSNFRAWRCTFAAACDVHAEGSAGIRGFLSGCTFADGGGDKISTDVQPRYYEQGLIDADEGCHPYLSDPDLILIGGKVYYVDSSDAAASNSNTGTKRSRPWATLAYALDTSSAHDFIIVEKGHRETRDAVYAVTKANQKIFGIGTLTDRALLTLATTSSAARWLSLQSNGTEVHNLRFVSTTGGAHDDFIAIVAHSVVVGSCGFTPGAIDTTCISVGSASTFRIHGCTFTISANGPDYAILVAATSAHWSEIVDNILDGNGYDWDVAAIGTTASATLGYCMVYNNTLRGGAHIGIASTSTTGWRIAGPIADAESSIGAE